tara:strand:+ start:179 stop:403 length:225 start_codon:yes stop_codon:yes gene_type:complete
MILQKIMLFKFILKKKKQITQEKSVHKFNINNWMNLTKEERLEMDFNEKNKTMRKKKALLKSIREEYIKIKNKK